MENREIQNYKKIKDLSAGEPIAIPLILAIMDKTQHQDIELLMNYNIVGSKLVKFYGICCSWDFDKFYQTLEILRSGCIHLTEVETNLGFASPISFLDNYRYRHTDEITRGENWIQYLAMQTLLFRKRLDDEKRKANGNRCRVKIMD